jgi:hypothetical protein
MILELADPCRRRRRHPSIIATCGHIRQTWLSTVRQGAGSRESVAFGPSYCRPPRTDVMRWVLKPSQCIRPT